LQAAGSFVSQEISAEFKVIFATAGLEIIGGIISAKKSKTGGAGGTNEVISAMQSAEQLLLVSPLAVSQAPLLLQPQSCGQLFSVSPPAELHVAFGQVEETVTPTFAESFAAKTKLFKTKLFEKSKQISIIVIANIFIEHLIGKK